MAWFERFFKKHKNVYSGTWTELRIQYSGKRIVYDPKKQTITYRNVIAPGAAGRCYPEGFFAEKTKKLSAPNAEQCCTVMERALSQLPLADRYDLLPPGASHECLLVFTKPDGSELCYANTHSPPGSFRITRDPAHPAFGVVFDTLSKFCSK